MRTPLTRNGLLRLLDTRPGEPAPPRPKPAARAEPPRDAHGRLPLTARQRQVYEVIRDRCLDGHPPSWREVQAAIGVRCINSVRVNLIPLVRKGWLAPPAVGAGRSRHLRPAVAEIRVTPNPDGTVTVAATGPVTLTADDLRGMLP